MWLSGGPFEFEQWVRGEHLTLVRNPNYWKVDESGQSLPYLDRVVVRFESDLDTMLTDFENRELDVINPGWDPVLLDRLAALDGVVVDISGSGKWEHLSFQFGDGRLTRNPGSYNEHLEYRLAVAHAIDRQGLVDAVFDGWGEPMNSYLEAFTPVWSQGAWSQYDYNPQKARDYLSALCEKEGVDCVANPPTAVFVTTPRTFACGSPRRSPDVRTGINYRFETDLALVFFGDTSTSATTTWATGVGRATPATSERWPCTPPGTRRQHLPTDLPSPDGDRLPSAGRRRLGSTRERPR
jgi:hypothetical protein